MRRARTSAIGATTGSVKKPITNIAAIDAEAIRC
jgi:hypothetical protein